MLVTEVGFNRIGTTQAIAPTQVNFGVNAEASIPCFDLAGIDFLSKTKRAELVNAFGDAMSRIGPGFVAIYVPELDALVQAVLQQEKDYFAQPLEEKMKDWHNNNGQTGYHYPGFEKATGAVLADHKESFFVTENMISWPADRPEFEKVMRQIHSEGRRYSQQIASLLLEYLQQPDDVYDQEIPGNILRLIHYLSSLDAEPGAEWGGPHKDINRLTFLFTASRSGLQMLDREGNWVSIIVPPGHMILNAGDQLEVKTAGKIMATPHRIVNDDPKGDPERYSFVYFDSWPDTQSLTAFENCLKEAEREGRDISMCGDFSVAERKASRLMEIGFFRDPPRELVVALRKKGLLQNPTAELKQQFPDLF